MAVHTDDIAWWNLENAFWLQEPADKGSAQLANRNDAIVHAHTADEHGIDVAYICDPQVFTAPPDRIFQHGVMRRTATTRPSWPWAIPI